MKRSLGSILSQQDVFAADGDTMWLHDREFMNHTAQSHNNNMYGDRRGVFDAIVACGVNVDAVVQPCCGNFRTPKIIVNHENY
eukprot:1470924-Ditylum_brightwellii.AAC.1